MENCTFVLLATMALSTFLFLTFENWSKTLYLSQSIIFERNQIENYLGVLLEIRGQDKMEKKNDFCS
jgi:hypothetical protein